MNTLAVESLAFAPVAFAIAWLMPSLMRPTLPFGVRVPAEHVADPAIIAARRAYRWAIAGAAVIAVGSLWFPPGVIVAFLLVAAGYLRARHLILTAKRREQWFEGRRQGVATDTSLRADPEPFPWWWTAPAVLVAGVTLVIGVVRYPGLPDRLVTHFGADGVPDRLHPTSIGVAFGPVFGQLALTALIVLLLLITFRSRPDLDAAAPAATARQHRVFLARMAKALLVMAAFVNLSLGATAWFLWTGHVGSIAAVQVPALAGVAAVLVVAVRTGQEGSLVAVTTPPEPATALTQRDDDASWRGGLVYINPNDPAVFVPKRFGIGWTLNLGNRLVWLVAAVAAGIAGIAVAAFTL